MAVQATISVHATIFCAGYYLCAGHYPFSTTRTCKIDGEIPNYDGGFEILYLILSSVSFQYVPAFLLSQPGPSKRSPAECFIITNICRMESSAQIQSKKRNIGMLAAQELIGKFKSK